MLQISDEADQPRFAPIRNINFATAVLLAAHNDSASISELVITFRLNGLGGDRACRKLIHRLERMNLLEIRAGSRDDRREKSIHVSNEGRELLGALLEQLRRLDL